MPVKNSRLIPRNRNSAHRVRRVESRNLISQDDNPIKRFMDLSIGIKIMIILSFILGFKGNTYK